MNQDAMAPFGLALLAFLKGDNSARVVIRRDDGFRASMPAGHFFRPPSEFSTVEVEALRLCRGRVLDIGAGTGIHSLPLQSRGLLVTGLDISPQAVEVMALRGLREVRCADIFDLQERPFDTLLMLGHGIGLVEDMEGLGKFLHHARKILKPGGQVLLDSQDVRRTGDPGHLAYHEANRQQGRYFGEVRLQFEFAGLTGPPCGWLHIDPETLEQEAGPAGWRCETILEMDSGDYLARLTLSRDD